MAQRKNKNESREATILEVPEETRLDEHVDAPSTVKPGDAPHDTTDPDERATSVMPNSAEAARNHPGQPVNAVLPLPEPEAPWEPDVEDRIERYEAVGADGRRYMVEHNLESGESRAVGMAADYYAERERRGEDENREDNRE